MSTQIGKLGDYSLWSWKGAVNGPKIAVEDVSADTLNGGLHVWKNYRVQKSTLEFTVMTVNDQKYAVRAALEAMQGTTQSLTKGSTGWIAKILEIEVSPSLYTLSTVDNFDTIMSVKIIAECEKAEG